ncbi:MAG: signal peptide peptidase SppA [Proteobacteria bacterium]|nr:signal peptide peptidase SppA [Pseudomonadota bacterium]MBU1687020.1 signal peptide peptidase SppA [Pseudomonadota bacterium]
MNDKRSFRQDHPVLTGIFFLAAFFLLCWGGLTFIGSFISDSGGPSFLAGSSSSQIGVIELRGLISTSEKTIRELTEFRQDRSIKAIVLRIDSPGGAVGASQEIFNEVARTDLKKPVVASMGSVAASGGYYAALGARRILANPGTLTGSIGVIVKFANLEKIFDKIGYESVVIKSGRMKDLGSSARKMTDEEKNILQGIIDNVYQQFVKDVSISRNLPVAEVETLADGRIYSGEQALESGLIDQFGNFTDALHLAAQLAQLEPGKPTVVYPSEKNFSILRYLVGEEGSTLWENIPLQGAFLSYEWSVAQ